MQGNGVFTVSGGRGGYSNLINYTLSILNSRASTSMAVAMFEWTRNYDHVQN